MKKRPLLFIILAGMHLLMPLLNILVFKMRTDMDWFVIFDNLLSHKNPKEIFDFWLLFPIAGIALLTVKAWAYPFFVGVQAYSIYHHLFYEKYSCPYISERPFAGAWILLLFNLGIIAYFALPAVRRPFFDRRMRWWEAKTRYGIDIECFVTLEGTSGAVTTKILNISETGAFIQMRPEMLSLFPNELASNLQEAFNYNGQKPYSNTLRCEFQAFGMHFGLPARIVNRHKVSGLEGIGIEFVFYGLSERLKFKRFMRVLRSKFKNSMLDETNVKHNISKAA